MAIATTSQPAEIADLPLKLRLKRAERMRKLRALGLIMPLFLFLMIGFLIPIGSILIRSVQNPELAEVLPQMSELLRAWDGQGEPPVELLSVMARELISAKADRSIGKAAKRLNYNVAGFRTLLMKTGTKLERAAKKEGLDVLLADPDLLSRFYKIDKRWKDPRFWAILKQSSERHTLYFLLQAIDLDWDQFGEIVQVPEDIAIYRDVLWRTVWISLVVTVVCLFLGYPIAFLLATLPTRKSNLLMILLLLPFWTSLLVRSTAWLVLLQGQGLVNDVAIWIGLWDEPMMLVRNRIGVYIAMVHILLPLMVLPMYSVMKGIDPYHLKAAASLGAQPIRSFLKVYLPQTIPGAGAGVLLVFILSLGYYITPALVGGPTDQMLSYFIYFHANNTVNWGLAAALSVVLMVCVLVFFSIYQRLVGVGNMRMN